MKKKYIYPNVYIGKDLMCGDIIAASIKYNKEEEADEDGEILTKDRSSYFYNGFIED